MPEKMRAALRRYAAYLLAWTTAGLFSFTQDFAPRLYRNDPTPWSQLFTGWMAAMYVCAALTPAMLWLGRRWPLESSAAHIALHLFCSAVFAVVEIAIELPLLLKLGVFGSVTFAAAFPIVLVGGFHGNVIRYWIVVGLQAAYRSYRQSRERESEALQLRAQSAELAAQLSGAQLSGLKRQLQPHFLFNTLGAIMVLVRQGESRQAEAMLAKLSDLLRAALEDVETQEVPLSRELEFLRLYLEIEQVRFPDRLQVRITASSEVADALVPHMALQPIVENAIRHGLGESEDAVLIEVEANKLGANLVLTVQDDGPGNPSTVFAGKGIGLSNTAKRLERLYGDAGSLIARSREPHGVLVKMTMPFHTHEGA